MPIFPAGSYGEDSAAHRAAQDAIRAENAALRSKDLVDSLERRLDRLALVTEALWTLLRERVGFTDEELLERIREVDLSDGQLDGKVRHGAQDCPACGRVLSKRSPRCIYCGTEVQRGPFEGS